MSYLPLQFHGSRPRIEQGGGAFKLIEGTLAAQRALATLQLMTSNELFSPHDLATNYGARRKILNVFQEKITVEIF